MKIYIILIILAVLLSIIIKPKKNNRNKKIYLCIIFFALTFVAAVRTYEVGIDTEQFYRAFTRIANIDIKDFGNIRYEFGFSFFCKLISIISTNPQIIIISSSLIIFPIIGRFIYLNSKDATFSTIVFILLNYYFLYLNVMRQAISVSILLIAFEFIKKDKKLWYIILVCLASLFHTGAIGAIILLFFTNKEYTLKHYLYTIFISIICLLFANNVFVLLTTIIGKYAGYVDSQFYMANYGAAVLQSMVTFLILTFGVIIKNKNRKAEEVEQNKIMNLLAFMVSLTLIFDVLNIQINILGRISAYFSIYIIIWIPKFISMIQNANERVFYKYIILIFMLAYWLVIAIYRPDWYGVIPYTSILGG